MREINYKKSEWGSPKQYGVVTNMLDRQVDFAMLVEKNLTRTLEWKSLITYLSELLKDEVGFKHADAILKDVGITIIKIRDKKTKITHFDFVQEKNITLNAWKIYNAFTAYATHEKKLSERRREMLMVTAENLLMPLPEVV